MHWDIKKIGTPFTAVFLFHCSGVNLQHLWGVSADPSMLGFWLLAVHFVHPPSGLPVQLMIVITLYVYLRSNTL